MHHWVALFISQKKLRNYYFSISTLHKNQFTTVHRTIFDQNIVDTVVYISKCTRTSSAMTRAGDKRPVSGHRLLTGTPERGFNVTSSAFCPSLPVNFLSVSNPVSVLYYLCWNKAIHRFNGSPLTSRWASIRILCQLMIHMR